MSGIAIYFPLVDAYQWGPEAAPLDAREPDAHKPDADVSAPEDVESGDGVDEFVAGAAGEGAGVQISL
jgi:hypothetical protein